MKRLLPLFLLLPFLTVRGQSYVYNDWLRIDINDTSLKVIQLGDMDHYYPTLLADCTYSWLMDEIIEVSSIVSMESVKKSITITAEHDPQLKNAMRVYFDFPLNKAPLKIHFDLDGHGYEFHYCEDQVFIQIPKKRAKRFELSSIQPAHPDCYSWIGGCSLAPLELFCFSSISLSPHQNIVHVHIPMLTHDFFSNMLLRGELMHITNDSIFWRGMNFVRIQE